MTDNFLADVLAEPYVSPLSSTKVLTRLTAAQPKKKKTKREKALVVAERNVGLVQRIYLRLLLDAPTYAAAEKALRQGGYKFDRTTLYRWRCDPDFARALHLMQNQKAAGMGFSKEKILLDAEKAKELALTPQPVLFQGQPTGETEVELGAYIRALELQGKALGIGSEESQKVQVNIDIDYSGRVEGNVIDG